MKKIIHFEIPLINNGIPDSLAIRPETLGKFMQLIKDKLGDEFLVIASPFKPSELKLENEDLSVYNFDMKQITVEELVKLIKE